MMVSLPNVLTTIAVVWLVIIVIVCSCGSKSDKEDAACVFRYSYDNLLGWDRVVPRD